MEKSLGISGITDYDGSSGGQKTPKSQLNFGRGNTGEIELQKLELQKSVIGIWN